MNDTLQPDAAAQISGLLFAVLLVDANSVIAEANHAAEDVLGKSAKRMIGRPLSDVLELPDEVMARISVSEDKLIARGLKLGGLELNHEINLTVSPLASHRGWRVLTFSDAGQDDMRRPGDDSMTLKAPAILAHEIKNPLAAIKGASQLLARKVDESDSKLTGMIADEVDRIARLIDRMQELGSNTVERPEAINVHQTVRKAMTSVASANRSATKFVEQFDPSLPAVSAVPDALEQVLVNLLSNAVDAVSQAQDEPEVTVRTRFVSGLVASGDGAGKSRQLPVEIAVCDNGPGLAPEIADSAYEPFVTSKASGQGLGLALVKKLVRDMGGRVSHIRNQAKGETEFRVHLAVAE